MTRAWFALCKALLTVNFDLSGPAHKYPYRVKPWQSPLITAAILIIPGGIMWLSAKLTAIAIDVALTVGQPEAVLTLAHIVAAAFVFMFGVGLTLNAFFFADDTALLLSLPLPLAHIISAKFTVALINTYMASAVMLLPVYAVYMTKVSVNTAFVAKATYVFLLTPIIPLAAAAFIVLLLVRLAGSAKRRDVYVAAGGVLAGIFGLGIQYIFRTWTFTGPHTTDLAHTLFQSNHGLSRLLGRAYAPGLWSMQTIAGAHTGSSLLSALLLLLTAAIVSVIMLRLGRHVFVRAWQKGQESALRPSRGTVKWHRRTAMSAVARAERQLVLRTPAFLFNGLSAFVIAPLLLFITPRAFDVILQTATAAEPHSLTVGMMIIAAWFVLASPLSLLPATGFSREGSRLWILTTLPVSARHLFLAKLWGSMSLLVLPCTAGAVITAYVLQLPAWTTLVGIVVGIVWAVPAAMSALAIDALWPNLNWTDPNELFRRGVRTFVFVAPDIAAATLLFIVGRRIGLWTMTPHVVVPWAVGGGLAITALLWHIVSRNVQKWLIRAGG